MLPQHLVCKYELNCEYRNIILARSKAPWWWSDKTETCRSVLSVLKCFMWNYMRIRWLINWGEKDSKFVFALAFIFLHEFFRSTYENVYEHKEHVSFNGRRQVGLPHTKWLMYSSVHEDWHNNLQKYFALLVLLWRNNNIYPSLISFIVNIQAFDAIFMITLEMCH